MVSRLSTLANFRLAEIANALGFKYRLSNLRLLLILAVCCAAVMLPLLGFAGGRIFAWASAEVPASALIVPLMALLSIVSLTGAAVAETLGKYRDSVSRHPNRAYFRSLDISVGLVHAIYVLPRCLLLLGFWILLSLGVMVALISTEGIGAWLPLTVVMLFLAPSLIVLVAMTYSLDRAYRQNSSPARAWVMLIIGAACGACLGVLARQAFAGLSPVFLEAGQGANSPSPTIPGAESGPLLFLVVLPLVLLLFVAVILQYRRLRQTFFRIDTDMPPVRPMGFHLPNVVAWPLLLWSQRGASWRRATEIRCMAALAAVLSFVVTLRLSGVPALIDVDAIPTDVFERISQGLFFLCALLGFSIGEMTVGDIGRYKMAVKLRHAVESGAAIPLVVAVHFIALHGPAVMVSAIFTCTVWVGVGELSALPALLILGACSATIVADRLIPPPRAVDGTSGEGLLTAMVGMVLASIPVLWFLGAPSVATILATLSALTLVIGALQCLRLNMTRLSS